MASRFDYSYKSNYKVQMQKEKREERKNKRYGILYVEYYTNYFKKDNTYFKETISSHGKETSEVSLDELQYDIPELIKIGKYRDFKIATGKLRINDTNVYVGNELIDDIVMTSKAIFLSTGYLALFDSKIDLRWYRQNLINRGYNIKTSEFYLNNVYNKKE